MTTGAGTPGLDAALLAEVSTSSPWPFSHYAVTIEQDLDTRLGLTLNYGFDPERKWEQLGMVVQHVRGTGLLASQPKQVKANDVLIQVNQVHSDVASMAGELAKKGAITLHFLRVDVPQDAQDASVGGKPSWAPPQITNKKTAKKGRAWKPVKPASVEHVVEGKTSDNVRVGAALPKELGAEAGETSGTAFSKGHAEEAAETSEMALSNKPGVEAAKASSAALSKETGVDAAAAMQRVVPPRLSVGALLPSAA